MNILKPALLSASLLLAGTGFAHARSGQIQPGWPGAGALFVGANYQPVDRSPEQIRRDIALMKSAGFNVVRMGDLSWDYFQPAEDRFEFKEFDRVMDAMHAAGIRVILDVPGLPAPLWLHRKYPGVDIVSQDGNRRYPAERYMEDISDPDYRRLARQLAERLFERYAKHPAVIAVGYDNEIGNNFMSYSDATRRRFIGWLKEKYRTLEALNKAWATQRWSRRVSDWDQIDLPNAEGPGAPEPYLDLRRFWSGVTISVLEDLEAIRKRTVPDKPAISNLWDSSERKGFDYLASYRRYVSYGAMGYYAGDPISGGFDSLMMKGALSTPIWFNEFTAGGGGYYGTRGRARMWAYFGLINGAQAVLAWTFNSHRGGEEQALFGLVDHDDTPSWKLDEFGQLAKEFRTLQSMGFPRALDPKVAIAYSFEARMAASQRNQTSTVRQYFTIPYMDHAHNAFAPLYNDNVDVAVINIGHEDLSRYRLVVVPGLYLMDRASAEALRGFVKNGGTVIMSAMSAKVDETSQWFGTSLPGRLSDVFGLATKEFYRTEQPLTGEVAGKAFATKAKFYEVLRPTTAKVIGRFDNVDGFPPAVTVNQFGKGQAVYVAATSDRALLHAVYRDFYAKLGIERGPETPEGVYARVVDGRTLYVNTTTESKLVAIRGSQSGLLTGKTWNSTLRLEPYGADLLR
ncbi:beta-galactosidase [Sphingomonas sp.]|uniref:beta-galactosidase n=1 Tax=Sphingomonas sp. TaxID=28214 RepID=UPI002EDBAB1C